MLAHSVSYNLCVTEERTYVHKLKTGFLFVPPLLIPLLEQSAEWFFICKIDGATNVTIALHVRNLTLFDFRDFYSAKKYTCKQPTLKYTSLF